MGDAMGRAAGSRPHGRSAKPTECPHAPAQRPEPIPHGPQAGQHPDRCSRDEPISLARRWARSRDRGTPAQKIEPEEAALLRVLRRWQEEATKAGHPITRITLAFEAGRDGFWLARWLRAHGIEAHVIHPTSVAVSREHRRAKTDRLDTALLKRAFLGWLRGERGHCSMAEIPTLEEEDAKRPTREREGLVRERTRLVNRIKGALARLGIRGFKPTLRHAPERLSALRLPEG